MRNLVRASALLGLFAATLGLAPPAVADTSEPVWSCRGSAAYVRFPGRTRVEPIVANGDGSEVRPDRAQCVSDDAGFPRITLPPSAGPSDNKIVVDLPYARTRIIPELGTSDRQTAAAEAGVASLRIESPPSSFVLGVTAATSRAAATCDSASRTAVFSGASTVAEVTLGGIRIPTNQRVFTQIGNGLNGTPVGQLLRIFFDEEVRTGDAGSPSQAYVRRAVRIQLFPSTQPTGEPVVEVVVAESKVDRTGSVCVPASERGSGLQVLPKVPIPSSLRGHPCARARGFGPLIAMIGTDRRDLIAGTDVADRIFALGGDDFVSARRGNDCVEGGSGRDSLDGDPGNDLIYGGTGRDLVRGELGRDRLVGGSANDRLFGGPGNDRVSGGAGRDRLYGGYGNDLLVGGPGGDVINTQSSRDRVLAGSGNDYVNAAVAGRPTRIDCGPGRNDFARINRNEVRFVRNCERVMISRRVR